MSLASLSGLVKCLWVRPGAYPSETPFRYSTLVRLATDKRSSLLRIFVTYGRKKFHNIGPSSLETSSSSKALFMQSLTQDTASSSEPRLFGMSTFWAGGGGTGRSAWPFVAGMPFDAGASCHQFCKTFLLSCQIWEVQNTLVLGSRAIKICRVTLQIEQRVLYTNVGKQLS